MENFQFEDEVKHNPWSVESVEDFRFYNCPECDHKESIKSSFLRHALKCHPRSEELFESMEVEKSKKLAKTPKAKPKPKVLPLDEKKVPNPKKRTQPLLMSIEKEKGIMNKLKILSLGRKELKRLNQMKL